MPPSASNRLDNLLAWYDVNMRDLPWRRSRDPYAVWVSEIMLQQTQVQTVIPHFERWMNRFPSVEILAASELEDALSVWQGLGYYRRCRMLHEGARFVVEHGMPQTAAAWRMVPGVGRYTAGAIASIGFGEPTPIVDGNVERVFARVAGCELAGAPLNKAAWAWASAQVSDRRPGDHNQALMELGATVCKPVGPACLHCPLVSTCSAFAKGLQSSLPVPRERRATVHLEMGVWVVSCRELFGVVQVPEGEWWAGMWTFPTADESSWAFEHREKIGAFTTTVTHHRIRFQIHRAELSEPDPGLRWVTADVLGELPLPAPQRKALKLATAVTWASPVGTPATHAASAISSTHSELA